MSDEIDLEFRPKTYFRPEKLEKYLLSKVKGAERRKALMVLLDAGCYEDVKHFLGDGAPSNKDRLALEGIHPMFMGGNYLPDTQIGEVEIARITIQSTTQDVTCVYARPDKGQIHYRVVDEYDGETLQGPCTTTSAQPMTLGELADFFLTAWPMMEVLESNFDDDVEGALEFFQADSEFYPDLNNVCYSRVLDYFSEAQGDEEE